MIFFWENLLFISIYHLDLLTQKSTKKKMSEGTDTMSAHRLFEKEIKGGLIHAESTRFFTYIFFRGDHVACTRLKTFEEINQTLLPKIEAFSDAIYKSDRYLIRCCLCHRGDYFLSSAFEHFVEVHWSGSMVKSAMKGL
jgi:hypothetical protein